MGKAREVKPPEVKFLADLSPRSLKRRQDLVPKLLEARRNGKIAPIQIDYIPFDSSSLADYNATMIYALHQLFQEFSNKLHSPRSTVLSSI